MGSVAGKWPFDEAIDTAEETLCFPRITTRLTLMPILLYYDQEFTHLIERKKWMECEEKRVKFNYSMLVYFTLRKDLLYKQYT
jgi:hypothetical protein